MAGKYDSDNSSPKSPAGRPLHTYTALSHEDLLRSHLQASAQKKAHLQNELNRMERENFRIKQELEKAQEELVAKQNRINELLDQLSNRPRKSLELKKERHQSQVFEVDGQSLTLEVLMEHFNGVIQKHHDLLNQRKNEINKLKNDLSNQRAVPERKEVHTQSSKAYVDEAGLRQDLNKQFSQEMGLIRKEYDQAIQILSNKNNQLENSLENLHNKLDQYASEINNLKHELSAKEEIIKQNETIIQLLKDKETENYNLKTTILILNQEKADILKKEMNVIQDLKNEIAKNIESKKITINELNELVNNIKQTPPTTSLDRKNVLEMEKGCQSLLQNISGLKENLDDFLQTLKQATSSGETEGIRKKDNLIAELEQCKKCCQDELDGLVNATTKNEPQSPDTLRDQDVTEIYDEHIPREQTAPKMITEIEIKTLPVSESLPELVYPQLSPRSSERNVVKILYQKEYVDSNTTGSKPSVFKPSLSRTTSCEACREYWPPVERDLTQRKSTLILEDIIPEKLFLSETREEQQNNKINRNGWFGKNESESSNVAYKKEEAFQADKTFDNEVPTTASRSKSHSPSLRNRIYKKKK